MGCSFIFKEYYVWWQSSYYLRQGKPAFLFSWGDHFMGYLQLCNRAESFREILIYYETTIEWSLESLAEETIKGIPNGLCCQCQEIQKVVILDVCLQRKIKR